MRRLFILLAVCAAVAAAAFAPTAQADVTDYCDGNRGTWYAGDGYIYECIGPYFGAFGNLTWYKINVGCWACGGGGGINRTKSANE